jgi:hypothetical protein
VEGRVERTKWSHIPITFSEEDVRLQGFPHNNALVIEADRASWTLGKLLVDNGSSAYITFADAYDKMGLSRDLLQPPDTLLYGFGGRVIHVVGKVLLPVSFGTIQNARTEYLSFDVVEMYYPYNDILGRCFLNKFEAIIHQAYLCVKIPVTRGVIKIWGHQNDGRYLERGRTPEKRNVNALDKAVKGKEVEKQPKEDKEKVKVQPDCDTKKVLLDAMVLDQAVIIGSNLSPGEETMLIQFLQKNRDVSAWSAKDFTGVDRNFIEHKLNIDASVKPRRQKLRKMSDDKVVAAKSEVQRLLDASVIREVMYPKWLANTVPVKKKNEKWRMCIDFIDINKATPKDNYLLPRMDQVIDSAASTAILSLLDCFSGYHQCWIAKEDEEKTSFITPFGTSCFVRMPGGLKNVGPTFTRMTGEVFKLQIGRNIQAYVDDLIVKSGDRANHISDLAETFTNMRRAELKLNPEKCVFGVTKGKILGCLISAKRIEAKLDKIKAIREMEEPKTKKDIQKLNGRVAALNRFISRSAERSLQFFKALKGKGKIEWGPEQSKAFTELKAYIEKMIILSPPLPSEPLFLYVVASKATVSAALVREVDGEKGKYQSLVYFVSEALSGSYCTQSWKRLPMQCLWPRESSGITSRHTRSLCSLTNLSMICSSTRKLHPKLPSGQWSCQNTQSILGKGRQSSLKFWRILSWTGSHQATLLEMRNWCMCGRLGMTEPGGAKAPKLQPSSLHQRVSS